MSYSTADFCQAAAVLAPHTLSLDYSRDRGCSFGATDAALPEQSSPERQRLVISPNERSASKLMMPLMKSSNGQLPGLVLGVVQ